MLMVSSKDVFRRAVSLVAAAIISIPTFAPITPVSACEGGCCAGPYCLVWVMGNEYSPKLTKLHSLNNDYSTVAYQPLLADHPYLTEMIVDDGFGGAYGGTFDANYLTNTYDNTGEATRALTVLGYDFLNSHEAGPTSLTKTTRVSTSVAVTNIYKAIEEYEYRFDISHTGFSGTMETHPALMYVPDFSMTADLYTTNIFVTRTDEDLYWQKAVSDGFVSGSKETGNDLSWLEFIELTYRMMYMYGTPTLIDAEKYFLLEMYGKDIPYYYSDSQVEAIEYLVAKGILTNPGSISYTSQISTSDMYTILMRVFDEDSRETFKDVQLTMDVSLLSQGYYPIDLSLYPADANYPEIEIDYSKVSKYDYLVEITSGKTEFSIPTNHTKPLLYLATGSDMDTSYLIPNSSFEGIVGGQYYHFKVPTTYSGEVVVKSSAQNEEAKSYNLRAGGGYYLTEGVAAVQPGTTLGREPFKDSDSSLYADRERASAGQQTYGTTASNRVVSGAISYNRLMSFEVPQETLVTGVAEATATVTLPVPTKTTSAGYFQIGDVTFRAMPNENGGYSWGMGNVNLDSYGLVAGYNITHVQSGNSYTISVSTDTMSANELLASVKWVSTAKNELNEEGYQVLYSNSNNKFLVSTLWLHGEGLIGSSAATVTENGTKRTYPAGQIGYSDITVAVGAKGSTASGTVNYITCGNMLTVSHTESDITVKANNMTYLSLEGVLGLSSSKIAAYASVGNAVKYVPQNTGDAMQTYLPYTGYGGSSTHTKIAKYDIPESNAERYLLLQADNLTLPYIVVQNGVNSYLYTYAQTNFGQASSEMGLEEGKGWVSQDQGTIVNELSSIGFEASSLVDNYYFTRIDLAAASETGEGPVFDTVDGYVWEIPTTAITSHDTNGPLERAKEQEAYIYQSDLSKLIPIVHVTGGQSDHAVQTNTNPLVYERADGTSVVCDYGSTPSLASIGGDAAVEAEGQGYFRDVYPAVVSLAIYTHEYKESPYSYLNSRGIPLYGTSRVSLTSANKLVHSDSFEICADDIVAFASSTQFGYFDGMLGSKNEYYSFIVELDLMNPLENTEIPQFDSEKIQDATTNPQALMVADPLSMIEDDYVSIFQLEESSFNAQVRKLDTWVSLLLYLIIVFCPTVMLVMYCIMMLLCLVADAKVFRVFCDKYFDPISWLTFGYKNVYTIDLHQVFFQSLIGMAITGFITYGNLYLWVGVTLKWISALFG